MMGHDHKQTVKGVLHTSIIYILMIQNNYYCQVASTISTASDVGDEMILQHQQQNSRMIKATSLTAQPTTAAVDRQSVFNSSYRFIDVCINSNN